MFLLMIKLGMRLVVHCSVLLVVYYYMVKQIYLYNKGEWFFES